ncbi:MAG: gluconokinase [Akkermansiaceae bacterium]
MSEHRQFLEHSIVLMGVSGCGKSTVGRLLSARTGAPFFDGDDFHPAENVRKMAGGAPLTDRDRQGWLEALTQLLDEHSEPIIIACSALKQSYRDILASAAHKPHFIYLHGERQTLLERGQQRAQAGDHFMPVSLLDSQLDTLEEPQDGALTISIEHTPEQITDIILAS